MLRGNILVFNHQAFSKTWLKKGYINPSGLNLKLKTKLTKIEEVRIIPKENIYVVEAVYSIPETPLVIIGNNSYMD
ncbi:MAG: hypothetical protein Kow0049_31770 [Stanieria sp.]